MTIEKSHTKSYSAIAMEVKKLEIHFMCTYCTIIPLSTVSNQTAHNHTVLGKG